MKTALFSAYAKTDDLAALASALAARGWDILASSGTRRFLAEHGIESIDVASIVGEPILGHRVVTLSREIHAGLLARREDAPELERLGLRRIDLVFVDLYPLADEMGRAGATEASILEKVDIGGVALLRAAAKGRRVVLSSPAQLALAEREIARIDAIAERGETAADRDLLLSLAAAAEEVAAAYCARAGEFNRRAAQGAYGA